MISPRSIETVRQLSQVEDVISDYVNLKNSGANLKGLCPFHNEKTPSFMVSPGKNIYKCFGCGKSGDGVRFLMDHDGLSFPEAIRTLAKRYNFQIEETKTEYDPEYEADKMHNDSLYIINDYAQSYFKDQLHDTEEGRLVGLSYFKERGFLKSTMEEFELGYADKNWDSLKKSATKKTYKLEFLQELGLVTQKEMDFFRERVIFPIHGLSGKVIAFAGRLLKPNEKSPKYLNSPESEIYNKRDILYAMFQAKSEIRKRDECILVEGYTDVISLHQSGLKNVVASSGTSLTEGQIKLIRRFTENIKILYDGDPAGIKAALRGIDLILEQNLNVRLVLLPENEDPDSYLNKVGIQKFENFIDDNAQDFILFKTNLLLEEAAGDPIKKHRVLKSIVFSISKIPDALKRNIYINSCSKLLDISEEVILLETRKLIQNKIRTERQRERKKVQYQKPITNLKPSQKQGQKLLNAVFNDFFQEREIVKVLMISGTKIFDETTDEPVANYVFSQIDDFIDRIEDPLFLKVILEVKSNLKQGKPLEENYFTAHLDEEIQKLAIDLSTSPYHYDDWEGKDHFLKTQKHPDENHVSETVQATLRFLERKKIRMKEEVEQRMKNLEQDTEEFGLLFKAFAVIKQDISEIQKQLGIVVPAK